MRGGLSRQHGRCGYYFLHCAFIRILFLSIQEIRCCKKVLCLLRCYVSYWR